MPARSALQPFDGAGHLESGTGPTWSLNPYAGCTHACTYCYVPDTMHLERSRWGDYAAVKDGLARRLSADLRRLPRGTVYISTSTDPYQPVEAEARATRSCLEVLARRDWPVHILTRAPLVTRDIEVLTSFTQATIGMTIPTLDDALRRALEPHAPPIAARLAALARLHDAGLQVTANVCPTFPFTPESSPDQLAAALADRGVRRINASPWRYQQSTGPFVRAAARARIDAAVLRRFEDATGSARTQATLRTAMARHGISVRDGFFNAPFAPRPSPTRVAPGDLRSWASG